MENKYTKTINYLAAEIFPKIKEVLVVFLYGSVARGDFSLRHSDLDLFVVLKKKKINDKIKEKINSLIIPAENREGVRIHIEYQSLEIRHEDQSLVRKMIEEGKIIYSTGVFSFGAELVGLKTYAIYDFSLKEAKNKTMFSKTLHGRKSWYFKNKKKILKEYKGIIDGQKIIELGKGTLMVQKDKEKDLKQVFDNFNVEYHLKKIIYG